MDQEDLLVTDDEDEEEDRGNEGSEKATSSKRSFDGIFFGAFQVLDYLGCGKGGGTVFSVVQFGTGKRAAAKWPVGQAEIDVLQELCAQPPCLGVPKLLGRGKVENEWYMVTEALGRPLSAVFKRIKRYPLRYRWGVVSVLGRMLLVRLEGMHRKGYVHNDVKPDNVLVGRREGKGVDLYLPYLIDFGTAQRFSGNDILRRDLGTVDFNSARSGRDLQRRPHDDLEALAWTMLHGLFGKLPWFEFTRKVDWSEMDKRMEAVSRVQAMKDRFLKEGHGFLGPDWEHFGSIPPGLWRFLQLCQPTKYLDEMPPYEDLAKALGAIRYRQPDADHRDIDMLCQSLRDGRAVRLDSVFPDGEAEVLRLEMEQKVAIRQWASENAAKEADKERMSDMIVWQVVGGEDRGGIMVRKGIELTSPALHMRLATGALVQQELLEGERLSYNRLLGDGPNCGWVSTRIKYGDVVKQLLVPHELTLDEFERIKAEEILIACA